MKNNDNNDNEIIMKWAAEMKKWKMIMKIIINERIVMKNK